MNRSPDAEFGRFVAEKQTFLETLPTTVPFETSEEWQEHHIELSQLQGLDIIELPGVLFTAEPAAGTFVFQIDNVRFVYKEMLSCIPGILAYLPQNTIKEIGWRQGIEV